MKLRALLLALIAWAALSAPALAAWSVTAKTQANNTSSASLTSSSVSFTAGNLIIITGEGRLSGTSANALVSGSVTGSLTVYQCRFSAGQSNVSFIAHGVAAGGSETFTVTDSGGTATALVMNITEVSGGLTSSQEDTAARACNSGNTTTPTVTSGAPTQSGELFISGWGTHQTVSGLTYTEDSGNGWTQVGTVAGNTNAGSAFSYVVNAGSSAVTHAPTTGTAKQYEMGITAFFAASAPPASSARRGALLGVGQ